MTGCFIFSYQCCYFVLVSVFHLDRQGHRRINLNYVFIFLVVPVSSFHCRFHLHLSLLPSLSSVLRDKTKICKYIKSGIIRHGRMSGRI